MRIVMDIVGCTAYSVRVHYREVEGNVCKYATPTFVTNVRLVHSYMYELRTTQTNQNHAQRICLL